MNQNGTGEEGNTGQVYQILLIEDSPGDVRLTAEALKEARMPFTLSVVPDGVEALAFLYREGQYHDAPRPDLILLDLNLPRRNGREVLARIKKDSNLDRIPVIVLTISTAEEDIITSYNLHANCYIIKPVNLENFFHVIQSIGHFWLKGPAVSIVGGVTNGS
jgi:CheY-like chemotaxis protein